MMSSHSTPTHSPLGSPYHSPSHSPTRSPKRYSTHGSNSSSLSPKQRSPHRSRSYDGPMFSGSLMDSSHTSTTKDAAYPGEQYVSRRARSVRKKRDKRIQKAMRSRSRDSHGSLDDQGSTSSSGSSGNSGSGGSSRETSPVPQSKSKITTSRHSTMTSDALRRSQILGEDLEKGGSRSGLGGILPPMLDTSNCDDNNDDLLATRGAKYVLPPPDPYATDETSPSKSSVSSDDAMSRRESFQLSPEKFEDELEEIEVRVDVNYSFNTLEELERRQKNLQLRRVGFCILCVFKALLISLIVVHVVINHRNISELPQVLNETFTNMTTHMGSGSSSSATTVTEAPVLDINATKAPQKENHHYTKAPTVAPAAAPSSAPPTAATTNTKEPTNSNAKPHNNNDNNNHSNKPHSAGASNPSLEQETAKEEEYKLFPPPPSNLAYLCSGEIDFMGCAEACVEAACCWEEGEGSCTDQVPQHQCRPYTEACSILNLPNYEVLDNADESHNNNGNNNNNNHANAARQQQSQQDGEAVFVPPPMTNLLQLCELPVLMDPKTDKVIPQALELCKDACLPAECCWNDLMGPENLCLDNPQCQDYEPCDIIVDLEVDG